MDIAIFHEITTEDLLVELEAEAKKYDGLYVDMEEAEQRKYVKDKASHINSLLKQLDRARIDKSKTYKMEVEAEAGKIKDRLMTANVPFQALIDEHKAERALIKAIKDASDEAKEYALQLPIRHEDALGMNELYDFKIAQVKIEQEKRDEQLKAEAVAEAKQDLINAENKAKADAKQAIENAERAEAKRVADVEQARIDEQARQAAIVKAEQDAENARLANVEHVRSINIDIKSVLMSYGISEEDSRIMIRLASQGKLPNVKISY